jgi:hypothetical protein
MMLLATVIGFPDLGPVLFPALHHHAGSTPDDTWQNWITTLSATRLPGLLDQWQHPLEGSVTPARAARWNHLVTAAQQVADHATTAGLPLPRRLVHWQPWVIPVGRLSFPTGPAVIHLPS